MQENRKIPTFNLNRQGQRHRQGKESNLTSSGNFRELEYERDTAIVVPLGGKIHENWGYNMQKRHSETQQDRKDMKQTRLHSRFFSLYTPDD